MRVRLLPADQAACSYYRHEEPARIARQQGVETLIDRGDFTLYQAPFGKIVATATPENGGTRITEWAEDVVVLQRPAKASTVSIIPVLQSRGIAVVVDVDDDFSCLHPKHPARDLFNPNLSPDVNFRHLQRACALADLVTVTTPALADRYGAHGRVAILPNCVPESMLGLPSTSDGQTLGWPGAAIYHPGDLEVTRGGVAEALRRTDWRFQVIGPGEGVRERLSLESEPDATGGLDLADWLLALGSLDVGIAPLGESRFNEAKSGLKFLEMAARGIPCVGSPSPAYQELADEGIGLIAPARARNWRQQLVRLMDDRSLREEMAAAGKAAIAAHHTIEKNGWKWVEAWESALHYRRNLATASVV